MYHEGKPRPHDFVPTSATYNGGGEHDGVSAGHDQVDAQQQHVVRTLAHEAEGNGHPSFQPLRDGDHMAGGDGESPDLDQLRAQARHTFHTQGSIGNILETGIGGRGRGSKMGVGE